MVTRSIPTAARSAYICSMMAAVSGLSLLSWTIATAGFLMPGEILTVPYAGRVQDPHMDNAPPDLGLGCCKWSGWLAR